MQLARVSFDILGVIPARPSRVSVRTTGAEHRAARGDAVRRRSRRRRCERLAPRAHDSSGGRRRVRADAWPGGLPGLARHRGLGGRLHPRVEFRADPERRLAAPAPGSAAPTPWSGSEACSHRRPHPPRRHGQRHRRAVSPQEWMFPNVDLTIHLFREPVRGWVGFDTKVTMGTTGMGLTSTTLHDESGRSVGPSRSSPCDRWRRPASRARLAARVRRPPRWASDNRAGARLSARLVTE